MNRINYYEESFQYDNSIFYNINNVYFKFIMKLIKIAINQYIYFLNFCHIFAFLNMFKYKNRGSFIANTWFSCTRCVNRFNDTAIKSY